LMHSACAIYQISALFEDHVIKAGAVVAKEHQSVVEGLVVLQVTETRARRDLESCHWKEMTQTERVRLGQGTTRRFGHAEDALLSRRSGPLRLGQ
jgi:hypothetical protein